MRFGICQVGFNEFAKPMAWEIVVGFWMANSCQMLGLRPDIK